MTADDARKLTEKANADDGSGARVLMGYWRQAIDRAARSGRTRVSSLDVDRPRCPLPPSAWTAVLADLEAAGFSVRAYHERCQEIVEVSW